MDDQRTLADVIQEANERIQDESRARVVAEMHLSAVLILCEKAGDADDVGAMVTAYVRAAHGRPLGEWHELWLQRAAEIIEAHQNPE